MSNNPLSQYFRQPSIYLKLPSLGQYYPDGTLNMPVNGEIPVYPMTAIDEITYRTPDALFNGSAVATVIKSCIPNVIDPWAIPAIDIDSMLVAIRIASYGHTMEVETTCPHCQEEAAYGLDLRSVLEKMKSPNYNEPIISGDVEIYFRPMNYKNLNDNNLKQFEEQKLLQVLPTTTLEDTEKITAMSAALLKLTDITMHALSQSITAVKTPTALVSEPEYIEEMLRNCDRKLFNKIRDHILKLKAQSELQPLLLKCNTCTKEYQQAMTLDMTSFFADAS
jgi:hypothetical protein